MIKRDELVAFIDQTLGQDLLQKARQIDVVANGVQIWGKPEVNKLALGVSLNREFLQAAIDFGADFCLVHHGLDLRTYEAAFPRYLQNQLKLIFQANLTVAGYHYVLDAHPTLGNNAQIIQALGANSKSPLYEDWGYVGEFPSAKSLSELQTACQQLFHRQPLVFPSGPTQIKTIGVVSGAGKPYAMHLAELEAKGVEAYISGETSESTPARLIESQINYLVCGHYATETFGVKALGQVISDHFSDQLLVQFLDQPSII